MIKSAQELFLQASNEYNNQHYEQALTIYKKIPHKNAAVWYNMANAAYKNGDYLTALLYWERAEQQASGAMVHDCKYNKNIVLQKLNTQVPLNSGNHAIPVLVLQVLFFCVLSVFLMFSHRLYARKHYIGLIFSVCCIGFLSFINYSNYQEHYKKNGLIMNEHAALHIGPDQEFAQLKSMTPGTKVSIIDHKNKWFKIRHEKQVGWLHQDSLEVI